MPMILSHPGSIQNQAATLDESRALFLKQFSGEILTMFGRTNVTQDKHMVRTIQNGRSAQFPVIGRANAYYHTPGERIDGGKIKHEERKLTVDELLVAPQAVYELDELMNHYDVRAPYSQEMGRVLSTQMDKHVLQTGIKAARSGASIPGETKPGTQIGTNFPGAPADADYRHNPDHLAKALYLAAQRLAENDVSQDMWPEVYCFLRPEQYFSLLDADKLLNRDYSNNGDFSQGQILRAAGIQIVMTNNLPNENIADGTLEAGTENRYAGDFTNTVGLVMHKSAVGTVKLMDLSFEYEWKIEYQSNLLVAKYAVGHGVLRPEAAVEIVNALV